MSEHAEMSRQMEKGNGSPSIYSLSSNYQGNAPWNIGKPQPALVTLLDKYKVTSPVLDIGCGAGDLAISIANRGNSVLGIDLSEIAIDLCKGKIGLLKPEIQDLLDFRVCNALKLSQLDRQFGSIVDSGFYHLFDQNERDHLAVELFNALKTGGRYYLLGFAINPPLPNAPKQVTQNEIEQRFNQKSGWKILELERVTFLTMLPPPREKIPAILACIEKLNK